MQYKAEVHYLNGRDSLLLDANLHFILSRLAQMPGWTSTTVTKPDGGTFVVRPSDLDQPLRLGLVIR